MLRQAGIDTNIFKGHIVGMSSASTAKMNGAQVAGILPAGGWSNESTFAKYYDKQIILDNTVQNSIFSQFI